MCTYPEDAFHVAWAVEERGPDHGVEQTRQVGWWPTSAVHCTPLERTASMTASTRFRRARAFAFLVGDNFQGVFLCKLSTTQREKANARTRADRSARRTLETFEWFQTPTNTTRLVLDDDSGNPNDDRPKGTLASICEWAHSPFPRN